MQSNEGAYERYRRRQEVLRSCNVKKTGMFIENSEMSTDVVVDRTQETIPVAMVVSFKEGADELFVFSYNDADFVEGDYYTWVDQYETAHKYFTTELLTIIKEVRYKKFKSYECNVVVNNEFGAYFKSFMKTAKDSGFSASHEEDKSLPILIAPKHDALYMGAYITIQDQTWRIIEADIYTLPAVGFYTLERSMNYIPPVVQDTPYLLYVGQTITLDTYGGKCDIIGAAKVVQRNFESVVIEIAEVGDGTLIITTYDDEDNATDHEYNIKEYI